MFFSFARQCPHASLLRNRSLFHLLCLSFFIPLFGALSSQTTRAQTASPIRWMHGGHYVRASHSAITPDGQTFVTTGFDATLKVRNGLNGQLLYTISLVNDPESPVVISPDGTRVTAVKYTSPATGYFLNTWRLSDGALLQSWNKTVRITSLAWSVDGTKLVTGRVDGSTQILDGTDGTPLVTASGHTGQVTTAVLSPDNLKLISGSDDRTFRIWNATTGTQLYMFDFPMGTVNSVAFAPDNRTAASANNDTTIRIWDTATGTLLRTLSANAVHTSVVFSANGSRLLTGSQDGFVRLWNVADGSLIAATPLGTDSPYITDAMYTQNETRVFTAAQQCEFAFYNGADLTLNRELPSEHLAQPDNLGISPDGKLLLAVAGNDTYLRLWDLATGALVKKFPNIGTHQYQDVAISPDGKSFATTDWQRTVRVWTLGTGTEFEVVTDPSYTANFYRPIAWSGDSKKIYHANLQTSDISIRSAADGSLLGVLTGSANSPTSMAVSPDGTLMATVDVGHIRIWSLANNALLSTFVGGAGQVAFSSDGKRLFQSNPGAPTLMNVADGTIIRTLTDTGGSALSPDGQIISVINTSGHLHIWSVATGSLLQDYVGELLQTIGNNPAVTPLIYSPDGTTMALSRNDATVIVLNNPFFVPSITGVSLNPASVIGGQSSIGTVTTDKAAPPGGTIITLASDSAVAILPNASVTIAEGATSATFPINTSPVGLTTTANITVSNGISTAGAVLTIKPPVVNNLSVSPSSVKGGATATGTITLASAAPLGGIAVPLSSGDTSIASVPASVTVAAGANSATFTVTSHTVASNRTVTLSALLGGTVSTTLTVTPPTLDSITLNPTSVKGGLTSTGTVTISDTAPSGGIVINLNSANTAVATVPTSVTVASGSKTATFTVTAKGVATDTSVNINSVFNGQTKSATLTVQASLLSSLSVNPSTVRSLQTAVATITLDAPAPTGGIVVTLSSSNTSAAALPASVTVPAGAKTANATLSTSYVAAETHLNLTATLGVNSQSVAFTVQPHLPFDFDNDGHNDLIFQHQTTNLVVFWYTSVLNVLGGSVANYSPPAGWTVVGCGDVNHDGNPDLFLQNQTTNKINIWYMFGAAVGSGVELSQQPAAGYKVVGIGDFNGDGKPDILFQQASTGQLAIWYLNGASVTGGVAVPQVPVAGYNVVGVGDFNYDGKPDIVFQNASNNQVVIWYMNGSVFAGGGASAYVPPFGWSVKAVEDMDNDGKADLVFQNQTTNQVLVWFMDGLSIPGGGSLSQTPEQGYKLRGPH